MNNNNKEPILIPGWVDPDHSNFNALYIRYIIDNENLNNLEKEHSNKVRKLANLANSAESDEEKEFIKEEKEFLLNINSRRAFYEAYFKYLTTPFNVQREGKWVRNEENARAVIDMNKNIMTDHEVKIVYEASNEDGEIHHNLEILKGIGD